MEALQEFKKLRRYFGEQVRNLIRKYHGEVVTLNSAPDAAALAMIHYMAVDGEAWEYYPGLEQCRLEQCSGDAWKLEQCRLEQCSGDAWKLQFLQALPWYRDRYGNYQFGLVTVPMDVLIPLVMMSGDIVKYWSESDFAAYHKWYCDQGNMPTHDIAQSLWPVVLDGQCGDEIFQDGWHRFHHYYRSGVKQVPCIYYL